MLIHIDIVCQIHNIIYCTITKHPSFVNGPTRDHGGTLLFLTSEHLSQGENKTTLEMLKSETQLKGNGIRWRAYLHQVNTLCFVRSGTERSDLDST